MSTKSSLLLHKGEDGYVHIYFNAYYELIIETYHGSLRLPDSFKDAFKPIKVKQ